MERDNGKAEIEIAPATPEAAIVERARRDAPGLGRFGCDWVFATRSRHIVYIDEAAGSGRDLRAKLGEKGVAITAR